VLIYICNYLNQNINIIHFLQNDQKNKLFFGGEAVSMHQGWIEGAVSSVNDILKF